MFVLRRFVFVTALLLGACGSESPRIFPSPEDLPVVETPPDPLVSFFTKKTIDSPDAWRDERRGELLELFAHYVYGYAPELVSPEATEIARGELFDGAAEFVELELRYHPVARPITLLVVRPSGVVDAPVLLGLNKCGNHTLLDEPGPRVSESFTLSVCSRSRGSRAAMWPIEDVISRGYAVASFHESDIDPDEPVDPRTDDGAQLHLPSGVSPDLAWGTIATWAYGLRLAVDALSAGDLIDATRIAVLGHSRRGKAALLAAAHDERIWLAAPHQSGTGGATLSRSKNGESVEIINQLFPHWFGAHFAAFGDNEERLPLDQHLLIALVAPRPVLVTDGSEDDWADPMGARAAVEAADPVYELVGSGGLELDSDGEARLAGKLAWHVRPGGHSLEPQDWTIVMDFADQHAR